MLVINKANTAPEGSIEKLQEAARRINPDAAVRPERTCLRRAFRDPQCHACSSLSVHLLCCHVSSPLSPIISPPQVYVTDSNIVVDKPELVQGKRVSGL